MDLDFPLGDATRDAYGRTLVELGKENSDIVVLDADLSKSTKTGLFAKQFPDRFFNVGIAEANMISMAAGFASVGKIPFASSFAVFVICKAFDQLRMCVAYPGFNVKVVASHGGISVGEDGPSQQSIEDLALINSLPGFVSIVPADAVSAAALVRLAALYKGPVYIRTGRPKASVIYQDGEVFEIGRAKVHGDGNDVLIVANGLLVAFALKAASYLAKQGIKVTVLDMHTVKPLDNETLIKIVRKTMCVVVAEEHLVTGGLGTQVAHCMAEHCPAPVEFVAIMDRYAESGTPDELLKKYGLTASHIINAVLKVIDRKRTLVSS